MKYYDGPPTVAVEVRSPGDYGPRADRRIAEKRGEDFSAGSLVVWDVDLHSQDVVRVYLSENSGVPTIHRPGQIAETEPAAPGWTFV
ncbi:MAG: hypothetical protein SFV23_06540 [Planctomycetaceae bacterium]|nr:hypothetical protein [Planctomycetaceae bacterium]